MHVYELPDDILTGEPDPKVYAKFLDDLIQICQNWLPGFWSIIPMLMRLKTHEDQFSPIEILTISEWQQEKYMGAGLGEVFQQQMSKLWSIVARGNTETLPTMQMTAIEGSLFQEIRTGGNGENQRCSRVEPLNIISFVQYVCHYHEKELAKELLQ